RHRTTPSGSVPSRRLGGGGLSARSVRRILKRRGAEQQTLYARGVRETHAVAPGRERLRGPPLACGRRASSTRARVTGDGGLRVDERPVTRYAKARDGVSIAYQVYGDGAEDLLFRSGMGFPIDLFWDEPGFVRFAKRLGGFTRVVMVDFRGVGSSGG